MRVTPKISDRPEATRNSDAALARPERNWTTSSCIRVCRRAAAEAEASASRQFCGLSFFTSSSEGR